jgi:hypothetical protein
MDAIGERAKIRNSNIEIRNNFEAQSSKSKNGQAGHLFRIS